jgi:hypothetical protein
VSYDPIGYNHERRSWKEDLQFGAQAIGQNSILKHPIEKKG